MTKTITKAKAEAVRRAVAKQFAADPAYGPQVCMDYDGHPAIVWEDGAPYEWTYHVGSLAAGYAVRDEEFGFTWKPVPFPAGVFMEPVSHLVLGLYPEA